MDHQDDLVKILIRYNSSVLEQETVETLWAEVIDKEKGFYRIDNIPFYGPLLAPDDIVFAEYDDYEQRLTYRKTVKSSDCSVVLVIIMDKKIEGESIRKEFEILGCPSEGTGTYYFAMEIPAEVDYKAIREILQQYEDKGILGYSEPCLSLEHRY